MGATYFPCFKIVDFKIIQEGKISEKIHNLNSLNEFSFEENQECLLSRLRNYFIQKNENIITIFDDLTKLPKDIFFVN